MKLYKVNQYTARHYIAIVAPALERGDAPEENTVTVVWNEKAVCMDILATGKRIVPILRKLEASMTAAGLAGTDGIYSGWFGSWADCLRDSFDRKYFDWNYSGEQDAERGLWSYSWSIEQLDENLWYVFLNLAIPEGYKVPDDVQILTDRISTGKASSAWEKGVRRFAVDMLADVRNCCISPDVFDSPRRLEKALLNGARTWREYVYGANGLWYDKAIARALCSPSELKRTDGGRKAPNSRELWLDVEERARFQAARLIMDAARV